MYQMREVSRKAIIKQERQCQRINHLVSTEVDGIEDFIIAVVIIGGCRAAEEPS